MATGGSRLSVVGNLGEWGRCASAVGELASVGARIGQGIFSSWIWAVYYMRCLGRWPR